MSREGLKGVAHIETMEENNSCGPSVVTKMKSCTEVKNKSGSISTILIFGLWIDVIVS